MIWRAKATLWRACPRRSAPLTPRIQSLPAGAQWSAIPLSDMAPAGARNLTRTRHASRVGVYRDRRMYRFALVLVTSVAMCAIDAPAHAQDSIPAIDYTHLSLSDSSPVYSPRETCDPPPAPPLELGSYQLSAVPIVWVWCATPALGTYVWIEPQRRLLPARDRTHHAWMEPAALADPTMAVTTVEGGARLAGAPGIPVAFLRNVEVQFLGIPLTARTASRGTAEVLLRHGDPSLRVRRDADFAENRMVVDYDRSGTGAAFEVLAGTPLGKRAAFASGLVLDLHTGDQLGAHGMAAVDYAPSEAQALTLLAMFQTTRDGLRDAWTSARWSAKPSERLALRAVTTAERLSSTVTELAPTTSRVGGQLDIAWTSVPRSAPHEDEDSTHWQRELTVSASGGGGGVAGERHSDAAFAIGGALTRDAETGLKLDVGVRTEVRTVAGERAVVVAPRAALSLFRDRSESRRFNAFLAYQRVPHLDDGAPGAWRELDALAHHEVALGGTYVRAGKAVSLLLGTAAIARDTDLGAYAWFRLESQRGGGQWPWLFASATTFGRVAAMTAQHRLATWSRHQLFVGATARATPDHTTAGAALQWWLTSQLRDSGKLGATLEADAGDHVRSVRLVVEVVTR